MKYIRTKDGKIIDLTSKEVSSYEIVEDKAQEEKYSKVICVYYFDRDIGEHIENDNSGGRSMDNWYLKDIIEQADTIEELCDGFIFKDTETNKLHFLNENDGISLLGAALFTETVRGYIETDKGLIYVAKLNKKGELELL